MEFYSIKSQSTVIYKHCGTYNNDRLNLTQDNPNRTRRGSVLIAIGWLADTNISADIMYNSVII